MPSEEDEAKTHHVATGVPPLIRRSKPAPQQAKSPEPTEQELSEARQLSQAAAVETPDELARRLSRLHEGLQDLDGEGDLPPAS